ncbi:MAG: hypothetical protein LBS36_13050 [Oscillospiraceae bacterium]|jgi:N-acetylglucosamine kinase-like BadF-type ATPase|nr:hypothetical protein [Oscillospiraceae bacterium]
MPDYFLGLDGGGTKTSAALADETGRVVCTHVGDSINYYSEGLEQARQNFAKILSDIKNKSGVPEIHSVFIGSSALFGKANGQELAAFTAGVCDAPYVTMDSDLAIALEGMMQKGECGVVISGTGSMAAGRRADGTIFSKGGYGYILGDEGSGYKIGLAGIQKAVTAFEGATEKTLLTGALQKKYQVNDLHDLTHIFYDPPIERKAIADFAKQVFDCAHAGDSAASAIIKSAARELAATAAALLREFEKPVPLGVFGGIFMHHAIYFDAFCKELQRLVANVSVCRLPLVPVLGAVLGAMKAAGKKITEEIKQNIMKAEI